MDFKRVPKTELVKFLATQCIPRVPSFLNPYKGRNEMFKVSSEIASKTEGMFLEFGVSSGKTINTIADCIPSRKVYGFDSFEGLPEIYTEQWGIGSFKAPIPEVRGNVELIVGLIENTLPTFLAQHPDKVSFINLDVDIYSTTNFILTLLGKLERFQVGSIIQLDEVFEEEDNWWYQDEYLAFYEFLNRFGIEVEYICWAGFTHCTYRITKIKGVK